MGGFAEELVFRGILQQGIPLLLERNGSPGLVIGVGTAVGFVVSSFVFGKLHSYTETPIYAFLATIVGAIFGFQFLITGDLLLPVATHALVDFLSFTLCYIQVTYLMSKEEQLAVYYNDKPFAQEVRLVYE